jgi:tetrahydromethanopterin S-methyltransferase subunit H
LFKFKKEQKIFEIGGVKVGGQPGELPTVLIGSIFHEGHKIVLDRKRGVFDKSKAENLIKVQEELSEKTGIPCMVDIVGEYPEALKRYIEFVSGVSNLPFLVNGQEKSVRIAAAKYVVESGLENRAIYNSINYTLTNDEVEAIKELKLKAAIVQAFNPRNPYPQGMVSKLNELLREALRAGIEKPLVLTPVLDVPSIGLGVQGVYLAKEEFGLPTGIAPLGVIGKWSKAEEFGEQTKKMYRASAITLSQCMGANFIIYGSLSKAKEIFPVCAIVDAIIAYNARNFGIKPVTKSHPLYKVF